MIPAEYTNLSYVPIEYLPHVISHTQTVTERLMSKWDRWIRPLSHFHDCLAVLTDYRDVFSTESLTIHDMVGRNWPSKCFHHTTCTRQAEIELKGSRNVFVGLDTRNGMTKLIIINAAYRVIVFKLLGDDVWDYDVYASVTSYLRETGIYPGFMTSRPCDILREECQLIFVDESQPVRVQLIGAFMKYVKRYPLSDAISRPDHCRPMRTEMTSDTSKKWIGDIIQNNSKHLMKKVITRDVPQDKASIFQGFVGAISQFMTVPELMILRNAVVMTDDVFNSAISMAMQRDKMVSVHLRSDGDLRMFVKPKGCARAIDDGNILCVMDDMTRVMVVHNGWTDVTEVNCTIAQCELLKTLPIVHRKPEKIRTYRDEETGMYVNEYEKVIGIDGGVVYIPSKYDLESFVICHEDRAMRRL